MFEVKLLRELVDIPKGVFFLLEGKDRKLRKLDYLGLFSSKSLLSSLTLYLSIHLLSKIWNLLMPPRVVNPFCGTTVSNKNPSLSNLKG